MAINDILRDAALSVVEMMTTTTTKKALERTLTPESYVVLMGDNDPRQGLSPLWTESLADEIRKFQVDGGEKANVDVFWLPETRPITAENCIDPKFAEAVQRAQIIAGTYGALDPHVKELEGPEFSKQFMEPIGKRMDGEGFRSYHVLARPVESVWEFLADKEVVREVRDYTLAIKSYLENKKGEVMQIYTPGCNVPLIVKIPQKYPVIADCFAMTDSKLTNAPAGETFFSAEGDGTGEIVMSPGALYHLQHPVEGSIRFNLVDNVVDSWENETEGDKTVEGYIKKSFEDPNNKWLAEVAIAVLRPIFESRGINIPLEDMLYNGTILEKRDSHLALGNAIYVGGKHDASLHTDSSFERMNIRVGKDHLLVDGVPNAELLAPYITKDN
jgi:hypothetical protein